MGTTLGNCPDCGTELTPVRDGRSKKTFAWCWKCERPMRIGEARTARLAAGPEGVPARPPHPISGAFQDYNDPAPDSLFVKVDETRCRCLGCGAHVFNNTESRDGHLSRNGCSVESSR